MSWGCDNFVGLQSKRMNTDIKLLEDQLADLNRVNGDINHNIYDTQGNPSKNISSAPGTEISCRTQRFSDSNMTYGEVVDNCCDRDDIIINSFSRLITLPYIIKNNPGETYQVYSSSWGFLNKVFYL